MRKRTRERTSNSGFGERIAQTAEATEERQRINREGTKDAEDVGSAPRSRALARHHRRNENMNPRALGNSCSRYSGGAGRHAVHAGAIEALSSVFPLCPLR